jgi:hypothetical protein
MRYRISLSLGTNECIRDEVRRKVLHALEWEFRSHTTSAFGDVSVDDVVEEPYPVSDNATSH